MFPSPSMSTPFSVKDILNLEHNHDVMVSPLDASSPMECCAVPTSTSSFASSCMLARLKQEPLRDLSSTAAAMFGEEIQESRGSTLSFAATFYGKSLLEIDRAKDGKSVAFDGKHRKGEFDFFYLQAICKTRPFAHLTCVKKIINQQMVRKIHQIPKERPIGLLKTCL